MAADTQNRQDTPIRVLVAGPDGHMGGAVTTGFADEPTLEVVGGIRRGDSDVDAKLKSADVLVDFTNAEAAPKLMLTAIEAGVRPVSGTSGLSADALNSIDEAARKQGIAAVWAPNFALGALVLTVLSRLAARYMDAAEVIEGHPGRKADAPSGTALALARAIREERGADFNDPPVQNPILEGIRGAEEGGVRLHSVRHPVPAMISWHEVIFTSDDGVLTLRHDHAGGHEPIPAIANATQEVMRTERVGLIRGYESVIGLGLD
jgi:4-hydroxy-tetrahydrodipicolinate reductase